LIREGAQDRHEQAVREFPVTSEATDRAAQGGRFELFASSQDFIPVSGRNIASQALFQEGGAIDRSEDIRPEWVGIDLAIAGVLDLLLYAGIDVIPGFLREKVIQRLQQP